MAAVPVAVSCFVLLRTHALLCRLKYTVVFPAKSGSAKISNHAAVGRQYCSNSGRLPSSSTIGFMPAASEHSRVTGDKSGHWLASWLAGRPGKPSSRCWLANRSPADFSQYLCNRPADSQLISNQPGNGQLSGSHRLERPANLHVGRQWVAISRATARQEVTGDDVSATLRRHALFKRAHALNNMAARKLLHSQTVLAQQLRCE